MRITPVGKVHHSPRQLTRGTALIRLDNVQSVAVEEERVIAEQFVQLWNQRMVIRYWLGCELSQSLFDLRGIQFHSALASVGLTLSYGQKAATHIWRRHQCGFAGPPTMQWSKPRPLGDPM